LYKQRFRLDIRKNFFTRRVVKHWNRLPRGVVDAPALEIFKRCIAAELGDMVKWWTWQCQVNGWT